MFLDDPGLPFFFTEPHASEDDSRDFESRFPEGDWKFNILANMVESNVRIAYHIACSLASTLAMSNID
jgi:hypothetical protein